MHELSIVQSIVTAATEALQGQPVRRVLSVRLRVGALSGIEEGALQFSYGLATAGTLLEGSALLVENIPVVIHCARCQLDARLPGVQTFRCPTCGTPSAVLRHGREIEIESLEVEDAA